MNADRNTQSYEVGITTSPELIQLLGKSLYSAPTAVILPRELLQNSRDATLAGGSIDITMVADSEAHSITITCNDRGCGMDEDTLVNTFLQIGKTGKNRAEGSVGGFGIAKVSLFSANAWSVTSRNNHVDSSLVYRREKRSIKGTSICARIDYEPNYTYRMRHHMLRAEQLIRSCDVRRAKFNGETVKAYRIRRLLWEGDGLKIGTAAKLNGEANLIFWRIRGLTQFVSSLGYGDYYGFNIIVDFDGVDYRPRDAEYPFDLSRERVNSKHEDLVTRVVAPLVKNKLTARRQHAGDKKKGREERVRRINNQTKPYIMVDKPKKVELVHRQILQLWRDMFKVLLNDPEELKANYGMVFTDGVGAQYRHEGGEYFLINPEYVAEWVTDLEYDPKITLPFVLKLWHLAVHELAHRVSSNHDEDFSSQEGKVSLDTADRIAEQMGSLRAKSRKVVKSIIALNNEK